MGRCRSRSRRRGKHRPRPGADRPGDAARRQLPRAARHDPDLSVRRPDPGPGAGGGAARQHRPGRRLVYRHRRYQPGAVRQHPAARHRADANIIDSVLQRDFIRESPPPWPVAAIGLVALLALATGVAAALVPTRLALAAGLAPLAAWSAGAQFAFVRGLWLPVVEPLIALAAAAVGVLLFRYGFVDRQRRQIHSAFRHSLAPDLVNALAAHPERLRLGGETREISVMFADIRGFTTISEGYKANPEGLSRLINRGFLSPMTQT